MFLGRAFDIPIRLHWTFAVAGLALFLYQLANFGLGGAAYGLVLAAALFGSVALHELGHAIAARSVGIGTRDITLYPIGGIARLEAMPEKPMQEAWVAIAGPLVNVVLGIGAGAGFFFTGSEFLLTMAGMNAALFLFNMLPAFPMDGGRIARAFFSAWKGGLRGTQMAVMLGRVFAGAFLVYGLMNGAWNLVFIGGFLFMAQTRELQFARAVDQARRRGGQPFYVRRTAGGPQPHVVQKWRLDP